MENIKFKTNIGYIYAICDPETGLEMYIGKTIHPKKRLPQHFSPNKLKSNTPKNNWIKKLISLNKKPIFKIMGVYNEDELCIKEIEYIRFYRIKNPNLKNVTDGGDTGNPKFKGFPRKFKCAPITHPLDVKYFETIKECSDYLKVNRATLIEAAKSKTRTTVKQHFVAYAENDFIKERTENSWKKCPLRCSNGVEYQSVAHASKELKICNMTIFRYLKKRRNNPNKSIKSLRGLEFWAIETK